MAGRYCNFWATKTARKGGARTASSGSERELSHKGCFVKLHVSTHTFSPKLLLLSPPRFGLVGGYLHHISPSLSTFHWPGTAAAAGPEASPSISTHPRQKRINHGPHRRQGQDGLPILPGRQARRHQEGAWRFHGGGNDRGKWVENIANARSTTRFLLYL